MLVTPGSNSRNSNLTPNNHLSERVSLNVRKVKPEQIQSKLNLNCQIRMKELVTEEDVISLSDE